MSQRPNHPPSWKVILLPIQIVAAFVMLVYHIFLLVARAGYWIVFSILVSPFLLFKKCFPRFDKQGHPNPDNTPCRWLQSSNGEKSALDIQFETKFARLSVDPASPYRILPQSLRTWKSQVGTFEDGNPIWSEGDRITDREVRILLLRAVNFFKTESQKATAVILNDSEGWEAWKDICDGMRTQFETIQLMPALEWERAGNVGSHDKADFGDALMRKVAEALRRAGEGGGLHYSHPYYCGHGLFFSSGKYLLATVEDGGLSEVLKEWDSETGFVAYFASLNDYICSGADPSNAVFRTDDPWAMANQRLTRQRMEEYVDESR